MDISQFAPVGVSPDDIVFAVLAVLGGWIAAHFASKGAGALVRRVPHMNESVAQFAARFTYYVVFLLGIGVALAFLGANVQPLLAIVLIAIVVVVLVLRGIADNFGAGVVIQTSQSVRIGDELQIEGPDGVVTGVVSELNARAILLRTAEGATVHVPNARALHEPLVNITSSGVRRSCVQVRLERPGPTVAEATAALESAAADAMGVSSVPPPHTIAVTISPERAVLELQFWHGPHSTVAVTDAVVRAVAASVDDAGWRATVTSRPAASPLAPPESL